MFLSKSNMIIKKPIFYSNFILLTLILNELLFFFLYSKNNVNDTPSTIKGDEIKLDDNGNPIPQEVRKPKRKVAVMVGYCGAGYHGMQYNPPNDTIESELFRAFVRAGGISLANSNDLKKNGFMRAARTDKGVHAGGNLISLKMIIEDPDIKDKINEALPESIRVWNIERVNKAFDCRKMCGSRWYEYLLPTYTLLGPRPGSILYNDIEESKKELPNVLDEDSESADFWKSVEEEQSKHFTKEEIEAIKSYVPPPRDEFDDSDGLYQKVKQFKLIENLHRRKYRISPAKLIKFRGAMQKYLGAHNFHNFTLGKDFSEPSSIRYMKEITVSEPFVIGEAKTEWVSIKIHGQSFMLHQIRKMISMATLITRCGCPLERIDASFGPQKINIPKAPALGLLLESPVFEGYNKRLETFGYNPIDFSKFKNEIDEFKLKHIYDKIYKEEVDENVFNAFYTYIDSFNMATGANGVETEEKSGANVQKSIFDFLTARGIPVLSNEEIDKIAKQNTNFQKREAKANKKDKKNNQSNNKKFQKQEKKDEAKVETKESPAKKSYFGCSIQ
ncbi:hypothetical protein TPHA_0E02790 [Tetrapisispora phaffii CBS 4417]|uniref:tRNA pseudouridine synthase 1 n=1 Tax=Tetrapisispora phaffii (strain ATCC 24235 / CBS 4417 / NBRC 1672 / NRRL Y-8282 / UCD 70-5) TaxID=1071381 RepID=G8BTZ1_TETPH|nr:hypothetical protein TPHA_0E02790 [Tetrapisispora phaffii CBS 4417]CCE63369.1 hypothetical protein TPHA_0E02790 [Tetrapisispora phaffii CBS 4417]